MKKAFTLIELLVVVLIIGILSAIALPQYQKAVERAKMAEALTTLGSLRKAVEVAKLANPGETITQDMLDVNLSAWENDNWKYTLRNSALFACRKATGFTCAAGEGALSEAAYNATTAATPAKATKCLRGEVECPSSCSSAGGKITASQKNIGMFTLVDLGTGNICCGSGTNSEQGISICKNFNAQ